MAKLGNICRFQSGGTPSKGNPSYYQGNIPWITTVSLTGGVIGETDAVEFITEQAIKESAAKIVPTNSIMVGTRVGVGKVAVNSVPMSTSQDIISLLDIDETIWDKEYLCKFISANSAYLNSQARGATIKGIKIDTLASLEVPELPINQQREINIVLNNVLALIEHRNQQVSKLDELVKSRFVELFGDQETNPYNLNVGKLSDVADIYLGLTHTPTYVEQGKPFLSVRDISSGVIDFSNCHYITEEEFDSLPNGARPKAGDMLFCRVGTIGKPVIIPENTPKFGTFVSVGYLRKKANVNNYYLKSWMENDYFMRQVYDNVAGASQINLNTGWLKNFRILIPSMKLQEQFAVFVEQTDKSKLEIQKSLEKLETLKKALMQKYFG